MYFATVGPSVRLILFEVSLAAVFGIAEILLGWLIRQHRHRPDEHRHEAV